MTRFKTAIIAFYEAWPPTSGAATVSYNLAKSLSGTKLLIQVGKEARADNLEGVRVTTLAGFSESRIAKVLGLHAKIRRILAELVSFGPDVVVLEGASWAVYHWLLLKQLRRRLPKAYVVYHSHNVEYDLRSYRNSPAIVALTRRAEASLLRGADISTAVSPIDQQRFVELYGLRPVLLVNGVDAERFGRVRRSAIERMRSVHGLGEHTILFSGFYSYPPNRTAVDFLVKSIMPALRKHYKRANLALTGGGAPYRESWINNAGSVPYEDFAAFVAACGIAVAPIFSGSGTRLKVLEAMAAGLPLVATEKAVEGLPLSHGEELLIASSKDEFLAAIVRLFEEPALAASLRAAARKRIADEFSWKGIIDELVQLIVRTNGRVGVTDVRVSPAG